MTRTDRHRSSGPASVLRCQTTPFRSTIAVLYCPRFRSTRRANVTCPNAPHEAPTERPAPVQQTFCAGNNAEPTAALRLRQRKPLPKRPIRNQPALLIPGRTPLGANLVKTAIVLRRTATLVRDRPGRTRLVPFAELRAIAKRLETVLLDATVEIVLDGDVRHRRPHALEAFRLPSGLGKHPSAAPRLLGIVNPLRIRRMRRAPIEGCPSILKGF